jgi:putative FmdB family regulatory protein
MPLYEYICQVCDIHFEKRVGFSEADNDQECPACGSIHSKKQISLFASTGTGNSSTTSSSSSSCGGSGRFT